jgi:hypothetical protein
MLRDAGRALRNAQVESYVTPRSKEPSMTRELYRYMCGTAVPPEEIELMRARSAGVGLLLATQSPGDFDYKCLDQIKTWLVERVKEPTALAKLKPMFSEAKVDVAAKLPGQGTGEFFLLRGKEVYGLKTNPSLIPTEQLPEQKIAELARHSRPK